MFGIALSNNIVMEGSPRQGSHRSGGNFEYSHWTYLAGLR
jgi:hypothetical protein